MALFAVLGGAIRIRFPGAPFGGRFDVPAAWSRVALTRIRAAAAGAPGSLLLRAGPPDDETVAEPPRDAGHGNADPPPQNAPRPEPDPPLPVVVLHRRPGGTVPDPPRRGRRRLALGGDPLEETNAPRALRSAIDQLLGGIAEKRDDGRGEGGS